MPQFESPPSGNHMPEAFRIHLFKALESRGWIDAARESASGLRWAAFGLGLAATAAAFAATAVEFVVDDSAPLPA